MVMDGIESIRIHNATDYVGEQRTIRWTEVFFIQNDDLGNSRHEPVDLSRLAETLASACCMALTPHLDKLKEASLTKFALRCTLIQNRYVHKKGTNKNSESTGLTRKNFSRMRTVRAVTRSSSEPVSMRPIVDSQTPVKTLPFVCGR